MREREIERITVDPHWETADVDVYNNHYPRRILPSRLELYEPPEEPDGIPLRDLMQDVKAELKTDAGKTDAPDAAPAGRDAGDAAVPMRPAPR